MNKDTQEALEALEWLKKMALRYSNQRMFEYQCKTEEMYEKVKKMLEQKANQ